MPLEEFEDPILRILFPSGPITNIGKRPLLSTVIPGEGIVNLYRLAVALNYPLTRIFGPVPEADLLPTLMAMRPKDVFTVGPEHPLRRAWRELRAAVDQPGREPASDLLRLLDEAKAEEATWMRLREQVSRRPAPPLGWQPRLGVPGPR